MRDVLRLSADGMSKRKIAASLSIGATPTGDCIRRSPRAGLSWRLSENLSDWALERILDPLQKVTAKDRRPQPDWACDPSRTAPAGRNCCGRSIPVSTPTVTATGCAK